MSKAVERLQQAIQFKTISNEAVDNGEYQRMADFLISMFNSEGFETRKVEFTRGKPIVIAKLAGSQPDLPSVLINGHYDVVPVSLNMWSVDPFAGTLKNGVLYGRGTQDMKGVIIQAFEGLLEARRLHKCLKRNVYITCVPDEEIGGKDGMAKFVETEDFKKMNVGVCLDEGVPSADKIVNVYSGERAVWWVKVIAKGSTGHASRHIGKDDAVFRLRRVIDKFYEFRAQEVERLNRDHLDIGEIATVNLTCLRANSDLAAYNVIPDQAEAVFDIRLPPEFDPIEFENNLKTWSESEQCTYEKIVWSARNPRTQIEKDNWWNLLVDAFKSPENLWQICEKPKTLGVATDARFIRLQGIPCFGMSAMAETQCLLHDHDERISISALEEGVQIYSRILSRFANYS
jgi:aminoacylase